MDNIEKILSQYFPSPLCRASWEKWSANLKGNIACSLAVAAQHGDLTESHIGRMRNAICVGDIPKLMELIAEPEYKITTIKHYSVHTPQLITMTVWHKGDTYYLLYGNDPQHGGYFLCMPEVHFSCILGEASELFSNAKKLAVKFDMDTAIALAECIQKVTKAANQKEEQADALLSEEQQVLQQPWATAMNLSARARNALHRVGKRTEAALWNGKPETKPLLTVQDVVSLSPAEIYRIRNMGVITRNEVREELHRLGVQSTAWYEV